MIVTIDGPAGSGKSTTARAAARRLGFRHLESGAFYRTLTLAAMRTGIPVDQWEGLSPGRLESLGVHAAAAADGYRMMIGEDDASAEIRSPDVTGLVSSIARVPAVRDWLLGRLRAAAEAGDLVADGRDMGTVVFPSADVKIFLTADIATRARRRLLEKAAGEPDPDDIDTESRRIAERDRVDSERAVAPLRPAPDAVHIDTTGLSFEDQVERIVELVRRSYSARGAVRGPP